MATVEEIVSEIKSLGATLHSMKSNSAEPSDVDKILQEINTLKAKYQEMSGKPFQGGTILQSPRKPPPKDLADDVLPPAPPLPCEEAAASTAEPSTYASRMIAFVVKLVGKKRHGLPFFDTNVIVEKLLQNSADHKALLGTSDAQKKEIEGWMSFASKVDLMPNEEFSPALALQFRSVIAPGTQPFVATGTQAPTLADLALYIAAVVCAIPEDTFEEPNTRDWRETISSFVAELEARPEPTSPPPTPRAPSATAAAETHLAATAKLYNDESVHDENTVPSSPLPTSETGKAAPPEDSLKVTDTTKEAVNVLVETSGNSTAQGDQADK